MSKENAPVVSNEKKTLSPAGATNVGGTGSAGQSQKDTTIVPPSTKKEVFPSEASSRSKARDYTLLVPESLNAIVDRHQFGIEAGHARGNWQSGRNDMEFVRDRMNHFFEHAIAIITGEHPRDSRRATPEDLDAALCNLQMLVWYRKHGTGLPSVAPWLVTPGKEY